MQATFTDYVEFVGHKVGHNYYRAVGFGNDTHFDAVHFVDDRGRVTAIIVNPDRRQDRSDWTSADEELFRSRVLAESEEWDNDSWVWAQFDPGLDQCTGFRNPKAPEETYSVIVCNEQGASDKSDNLTRDEVESYIAGWANPENLRVQIGNGFGNVILDKPIGEEFSWPE